MAKNVLPVHLELHFSQKICSVITVQKDSKQTQFLTIASQHLDIDYELYENVFLWTLIKGLLVY